MSAHGIVIGGGIGGLLTAHALAGRFERVTVLERDRYPPDTRGPAPPARRGVPQGRCLHLLMAAGAAAFDEIVPGWRRALIAGGAVPFDASADAMCRFQAGWLQRTPSGITTYACSRALLEGVLRTAAAARPEVRVRQGQRVLGLLGTPRGERVTGVRLADSRAGGETALFADLVVDASGCASALPEWIARVRPQGAPPVEETVVHSGTQYVSRWFHLEPRDAPDWHCLSMAPSASSCSAMMLRAEDDRWGVVLLAPAGLPLPLDDQGFLDFAAGLGDGTLRAALARATPASPTYRYGDAFSRMRHFNRLADWPAGLVALGDAVCALDPYLGLGMTAAARGVALLKRHLDQPAGVLPGVVFQKQLAALNGQPWRLATDRDADGQPLARDRARLSRLYEMAPSRPDVARALLAVQHLLRPVETLTEFCRP